MTTLEGMTIHPRCRHISSCWDLLERFQLFGTSQNISRNSISNFFWKNNQIFGSPCCSTREDLSIDVSIINVGMMLTKLMWFQLFGTIKIQVKIQFQTFLKKKNHFFVFQCCSTREDLSIDVSITNVGLISTKPGRFLFSGYGQNSISNF